MNFISRWFLRRKGLKRYAKTLATALAKGDLDSENQATLTSMVQDHLLKADDLLPFQRQALRQLFLTFSQNGTITDQDKKTLENVTRYFGRTPAELEVDQHLFNKLWALHFIQIGQLPEIRSVANAEGLVLHDGEQIHWLCAAAVMKRKRITKRIGYAGPTVSIKIAKGIRYRIGSISVQPVSDETLVREDLGFLWMTNTRIGFKGDTKLFSVDYSKIAAVDVSEGLVKLFKQGKEAPYLLFLDDPEVPCGILSLMLNPTHEDVPGVATG